MAGRFGGTAEWFGGMVGRFGCSVPSREGAGHGPGQPWEVVGTPSAPRRAPPHPTPSPGAASLPATGYPVSPGFPGKGVIYCAGCSLVTWKRENTEEVRPVPVPPSHPHGSTLPAPQHPPHYLPHQHPAGGKELGMPLGAATLLSPPTVAEPPLPRSPSEVGIQSRQESVQHCQQEGPAVLRQPSWLAQHLREETGLPEHPNVPLTECSSSPPRYLPPTHRKRWPMTPGTP